MFGSFSRHFTWSFFVALVLGVAQFGVGSQPVQAASISVSPTMISVKAPSTTGVLTIIGDPKAVTVAQVRVLKITFKGKEEILSSTKDVFATPPAMKLRPQQEVSVRLVRKTSRPVKGRECYRVLVDQIPQKDVKGAVIGFVIRQSIPMCFEG
jgi:fimbrial chaperone protein